MHDTFTLLLAGDVSPTKRLIDQVSATRVIAVDGGIRHAETLGLEPEVWVGDFDSSKPEDQDRFAHVERIAHPPAKDKTDGELAVEEALSRGAKRLLFVGSFGGRTDHTFALLASACAIAQRGIGIMMSSGSEEAHALGPKPNTFDLEDGTTFSVLAFCDLKGLTLEGARWPLDAITMDFGDTLTLSNEVKGTLTASLEKGRAMLVATFSV